MAERTDVLVIGAGVFGLWSARALAAEGLRVILTEAAAPGAGASGGVVGALTPHLPTRWDSLKRFQLHGLVSLGDRVAELTAETGIETGHARTGRMTPLRDEADRDRALAAVRAADLRWGEAGRIEVLDRPFDPARGLISPELCPGGLLHDTLSGRIDPRRLVRALAASVEARAELRTGWRLEALDGGRGVARFDRGEIEAGHIVLAAGWRSFGLAGVRGGGVKGQAALLAAQLPEATPVIQGRGLFIVRQGERRVAIGSTSEPHWTDESPDAKLDDLVRRAGLLVPALRDAPVLERWRGIRPKGPGNDPVIGPLPDAPRVILASGGYRIGLGIAHLAGEAVARLATGRSVSEVVASFASEIQRLAAP